MVTSSHFQTKKWKKYKIMEMKTQRDSMILRCYPYIDIFCIYNFVVPHLLQKQSKCDRKTFWLLLLLQLQSHQGWALTELSCILAVRDFCKDIKQAKVILQTGKNRNTPSADVILQHGILLLSLTSLNISTDIYRINK